MSDEKSMCWQVERDGEVVATVDAEAIDRDGTTAYPLPALPLLQNGDVVRLVEVNEREGAAGA